MRSCDKKQDQRDFLRNLNPNVVRLAFPAGQCAEAASWRKGRAGLQSHVPLASTPTKDCSSGLSPYQPSSQLHDSLHARTYGVDRSNMETETAATASTSQPSVYNPATRPAQIDSLISGVDRYNPHNLPLLHDYLDGQLKDEYDWDCMAALAIFKL